MSMSDFGGSDRPRTQMIDRTVGSGQRDPWNNPIKQEPQHNLQPDPNKPDPNAINDDMIDKIWQAHTKQNDPNNPNPNSNPNLQPQTDPPDPQARLNTYLKGVGLDPITIDDKEKEQMASGDYTTFLDKINQRLVNAHVKALAGAETMINAAVTKAVNETKSQMTASREGEKNRDLLHQTLPWASDPAISPVAQSVMQRFLSRGMTTEAALEGTKLYFARLNTKMNNAGTNKNRSANFSTEHKSSGVSGEPEGGWLAVLTGQGRPNE